MKFMHSIKKGWALVTLVALVIMALNLVALLAPTVTSAAATDFYVNPVGTDDASHGTGPGTAAFKTIQYAVNDSRVVGGKSIGVAAGTYTENVTVNKSITLVGASSATVTVTAVNPAVQVFNVTASSVNISGFTVSGSTDEVTGAGIYIAASVAYCNISNNVSTGNFDGIQLAALSNHNTLSNNTCSSSSRGQGFELHQSDYNTLTNNTANSNFRYGFKMDSASHNILTGNIANSNARHGFYLTVGFAEGGAGSNDNTFTNNTANLNTLDGIRISGSDGNTLTGNTVNANVVAGIYTVTDSLSGQTVTNLTMSNNTITNSPTGIDITGGVTVATWTVSNNNLSGSSTFGINNVGTGTLNAVSNWWGNASGPSHASNTYVAPGGTTGQVPVSDNVTFVPWLSAASGGTDMAPVTRTIPDGYFLTPTLALADAGTIAGSVLTLAAGTHTGDIVVNKSGVTLQSASGAASTTLQLVTGVGIDLQGGAGSTKIGGTAGKGLTILSGGTTTFLIQLANAPSNVEISYNTINTTGNASQGISIGAAGASDLTVTNNTFSTTNVGDGAIWGPIVVNVNVSHNTFVGPSALAGSGYAVQFSGVTGTSVIHGNNISNTSQGIFIYNNTPVSGLTIDGNTVSGAVVGLRFGHSSVSALMTTVTATNNVFSGNTTDLRIENQANVKASQFTINHNSFSGTSYGLNNLHATETADAVSCWWGNASGPSHATNKYTAPGGTTGQVVASGSVTFVPWLNAASGSDMAPVTRTSPAGYFLTPALALADGGTTTGSVLTLGAGTFTGLGTTTVDKSVTVKSAAGTYNVATALQTIITGTGTFSLDANNITLSGLIFETVTDPISALSPPDVSGVTISNNKLHNAAHVGIEVAGGVNMTITGNVIDGVTGLGDGMYLSRMTGTTISNNNIANCGFEGIVNKNDDGHVDNLVITGNTFSNIGSSGEAGFNLYGINGATISGNTMTSAPIFLFANTLTTGTINIINNTITNPAGPSAGKAILTDGSNLGGATVNITSNNLGSNSYGVYNPGTVDINAINNWWGNSSGPYNATSNPSGTGSAVTDHVIFNPWKTIPVVASYSWQFISQTSDKNLANLSPGETATITLTAKNTGNTTWLRTGSNPVRVGTTNPRDRMSTFANGTWLGANRPVGLPDGTNSVAPNATVTFTWTYTAPARAGTYREHFSLVTEGITWMNDPGVNYYTVVKGNYSWQFISQTSDKDLANLSTGEEATITLTAKNTGNATWFRTGSYPVRVGTTHPRDRSSAFANGTWLGANRPVGLPGGTDSVAPNATVTFTWTYTAPATLGTYREYFSLVTEGITWMNDPGVNYYTVVH